MLRELVRNASGLVRDQAACCLEARGACLEAEDVGAEIVTDRIEKRSGNVEGQGAKEIGVEVPLPHNDVCYRYHCITGNLAQQGCQWCLVVVGYFVPRK